MSSEDRAWILMLVRQASPGYLISSAPSCAAVDGGQAHVLGMCITGLQLSRGWVSHNSPDSSKILCVMEGAVGCGPHGVRDCW